MNQCSVCGTTREPLKQGGRPRIFIADPDEMKKLILKCSGCGRLTCGSCSESAGPGGLVRYSCPSCRGNMGACDA